MVGLMAFADICFCWLLIGAPQWILAPVRKQTDTL
jgi:hypothetical protein